MTLRRPSRLVAIAAAALAMLTGGCASTGERVAPSAGVETRVVTADNGEVTIPVHPQRVVATGYAVPALIEAGAPLVGISMWARGVPMNTLD
jgi:iron complex transport system substrate-binding protein